MCLQRRALAGIHESKGFAQSDTLRNGFSLVTTLCAQMWRNVSTCEKTCTHTRNVVARTGPPTRDARTRNAYSPSEGPFRARFSD